MIYDYEAWIRTVIAGYEKGMYPSGACNDADYVLQRFRRTFPTYSDTPINPIVKVDDNGVCEVAKKK